MNDFAAEKFNAQRASLLRIAYRMLGSMNDAEDIVQEAFIRWSNADRSAIELPAAYLHRIVTRLCLDHLKSARSRRIVYSGPWLPEPVVEDEPVEDVTLPLLLALERLSPLERAVFLLHDVFGQSFDDIAATIGRNAVACRQLAARARANVRQEQPRYAIDRTHGMAITAAFFQASQEGTIENLSTLLAEDVRLHADGGGKRPAIGHVLAGSAEVLRMLATIVQLRSAVPQLIRYAYVNGLPGFVTREADGVLQTTALLIDDGLIRAIYVMRNPEKLRHLEQIVH